MADEKDRNWYRYPTSRVGEAEAVAPGVRVNDVGGDVGADVGIEEAKQRFGGVDIPATLAGMLAALGAAVVLGGLLAGAGAFGYQLGLEDAATKLSLGGLIGGLVTLSWPSRSAGGWPAGSPATTAASTVC